MIDLATLKWKCEDEGLGYCVLYYFSLDSILSHPDLSEEFKEAWRTARGGLKALERLLDEMEDEEG